MMLSVIDFDNRVGLAKAYAEDGALKSAARVLNDLAAELVKLAEAKDKALDAIVAKRGA